MSNLIYSLYDQSVMRLVRTLVIKHEASIDLMNREVQYKSALTGMDVDYDRPETWKYYLNISGRYHYLDVPMTIVSLDTLETINFDRDVLVHHRSTLREYQYGSQYYNALVAKYPNQELLIRGILNPIDIHKAIAAEDYSILYYRAAEVESNEHNLIPNLQKWIFAFRDRWWIRDFAQTDDLYPITMFGIMFTYLPSVVMQLRFENCRTYHAHSFHVWNYLDSHGYLSNYKEYLTTKQVLWLYRNIKWVYANAGKRSTFGALMDIVLSHRGIPVGEYSLRHNLESMPDAIRPTPDLVRTPLNLKDLVTNDIFVRTVDYIAEKQLPLARDNALVFDEDLRDAKNRLARTLIMDSPTKVYESDMADRSEQLPFLLSDVLVNHWVFLSATNRYNAIINVGNPYTGEIMTMTAKDALITWLYAMNRAEGHVLGYVPDIVAANVRRIPLPTFTQLRGLAERKYVSDSMIMDVLNDQAIVGTAISTEGFYEMCYDVHQTMLRHRTMYTSQDHKETRGQYEAVIAHCYQDIRLKLTSVPNLSYEQYFNEKGWIITELGRSDLELLAVDIFNTALGLDVKNTKSLREIQSAMLRLMQQLGTYSTQYIATINSVPAMVLDPMQIRIGDFDVSAEDLIRLRKFSIGHITLDVKSKDSLPIGKSMIMPRIDLTYKPTYGFSVRSVVELDIDFVKRELFRERLAKIKVDFIDHTDLDSLVPEGMMDELIASSLSGGKELDIDTSEIPGDLFD